MRDVVALHGFWGGPEDWQPLHHELRDLPLRWRAPDLFANQELPLDVSLSEWARAFVDWVERTCSLDPRFIGYSMGGRLLLQALRLRPHWAHRSVLVSAFPLSLHGETKAAREQSDRDWAARFLRDEEPVLRQDWLNQEVLATSSLERAPRSLTLDLRKALAHALREWSVARQESVLDQLGRPGPLWVAGGRDRKFCELYRRLQSDQRPGSWIILEDCGHRILTDAPSKLGQEIRRHWELSDHEKVRSN